MNRQKSSNEYEIKFQNDRNFIGQIWHHTKSKRVFKRKYESSISSCTPDSGVKKFNSNSDD